MFLYVTSIKTIHGIKCKAVESRNTEAISLFVDVVYEIFVGITFRAIIFVVRIFRSNTLCMETTLNNYCFVEFETNYDNGEKQQ